MFGREIKNFGATMDLTFERPIAFAPGLFESVVDRLCSAVGFRVPADQIRVRHSDVLYQYDMHAAFFGGHGTFHRTAERMTFSLMNGQNRDDVRLILNLMWKFGREFLSEFQAPARFAVSINVDAGTSQERDEFLSRFAASPLVYSPGAIGYVKCDPYKEPIRVSVEPAVNAPEAVFVYLVVNLPGRDDFDVLMEETMLAFESAAKEFDIHLALSE